MPTYKKLNNVIHNIKRYKNYILFTFRSVKTILIVLLHLLFVFQRRVYFFLCVSTIFFLLYCFAAMLSVFFCCIFFVVVFWDCKVLLTCGFAERWHSMGYQMLLTNMMVMVSGNLKDSMDDVFSFFLMFATVCLLFSLAFNVILLHSICCSLNYEIAGDFYLKPLWNGLEFLHLFCKCEKWSLF